MPGAWRHRRPGLGPRKGPPATDVAAPGRRPRARSKVKGEMTHAGLGHTLEPGPKLRARGGREEENPRPEERKKPGVEGGSCPPPKGPESRALLSASSLLPPPGR
ncbi:hypothetical protein VULLAG_LOCUS21620 [Vulpes lagopus]